MWGSTIFARQELGRSGTLQAQGEMGRAAASLLPRLGILGQFFALDRVPGDNPEASASVEMSSFESHVC